VPTRLLTCPECGTAARWASPLDPTPIPTLAQRGAWVHTATGTPLCPRHDPEGWNTGEPLVPTGVGMIDGEEEPRLGVARGDGDLYEFLADIIHFARFFGYPRPGPDDLDTLRAAHDDPHADYRPVDRLVRHTDDAIDYLNSLCVDGVRFIVTPDNGGELLLDAVSPPAR